LKLGAGRSDSEVVVSPAAMPRVVPVANESVANVEVTKQPN